jgi:hypothetical protein
MGQRIKRVSCSPERTTITLDNGTRVRGKRNLVTDTILSEMLLQQFPNPEEPHPEESELDAEISS